MQILAAVLQALVSASIFFVWVVRYNNIIEEFKHYQLPPWLRDLVGILKLTCSVLLLLGLKDPVFAIIGAVGIAVLMACAFVIHLKVSNPVFKMLPSLSLLVLSILIALLNYQSVSV
jgi:uncharacterized membrane protein YphA (DoxX/SURF4 family)